MRAREDISVIRTPKRQILEKDLHRVREGHGVHREKRLQANVAALAETPGALHIGTGCGRAWFGCGTLCGVGRSRIRNAKIAGLKTRTYNFFARRKELSAKRKNSRAKATATAMSQ